MMLPFLSLLLAQAAAAAALPSPEQDRLTVCERAARRDPTEAIATASAWLKEAVGAERSYPQECLGFAFVSLLRWQAAEDAFAAARDARPAGELAARAKLAAMAGNAALADNRYAAAIQHLDPARGDAAAAGDAPLAGEIAADRAQAYVGLGDLAHADAALADARRDAPQRMESWLLSATLARRQGKLADAQKDIETAAALAPKDPAVGLEAGVIAALAGRDEAARQSWRSVIELAPNEPQAATARDYLAQIGEGAKAP